MFDLAKDAINTGIKYLKTMDLNHNKIPDLQEAQTDITNAETALKPILAKITSTHVLAVLTQLNTIAGNPVTATDITTAITVGTKVFNTLKTALTVFLAIK